MTVLHVDLSVRPEEFFQVTDLWLFFQNVLVVNAELINLSINIP